MNVGRDVEWDDHQSDGYHERMRRNDEERDDCCLRCDISRKSGVHTSLFSNILLDWWLT